MNQSERYEYLNGRIVVETLPAQADSTDRFRGGDARGEVAMIVSGDNLQHVELAEFRTSGIKRGFHYHTTYLERLYVIQGSVIVAARLIANGEQVEFIARAGQLITIHPQVAHAFLSLEESLVLSMGTGPSPFQDRHKFTYLHFKDDNNETDETNA